MNEANERSSKSLRDIAARLQELQHQVSQKLMVRLQRLDGSTHELPLARAAQVADVQSAELRREAESIVINARLSSHDRDSLSKERAQPESVKEWFAAIASGQLAVVATAAFGALASRALLLAFIAGIVGVSAHSAGTESLIGRAKEVELSLLEQSGDTQLEQAIQAATKEEPPSCAEPESCADDATTAQSLHRVFRSASATAFQRSVANTLVPARGRWRDDAFRVGAADARRAILQQSARAAAPSPDIGADGSRYQASEPHAVASQADPLDEALERRVRRLRANEPLWLQLRAMAARPVPVDYVAEAWLRTAFSDLDAPQRYSMQTWSEQASADFAKTLVQTRDLEQAARAVTERHSRADLHVGTLYDRRAGNFVADAPQRVHAQAERYASGVEDPGSIRRTNARPGTYTASTYESLFPAVANDLADGGPGFSGSGSRPTGSGGRAGEASGTRPARSGVTARSFGSVRFSARVGGVVFGRTPTGGSRPDIVQVRGQLREASKLYLSVRMRDGHEVLLGPYHPAVAQHALAYAADARVVVSTLPTPYREEGQSFEIPGRRVAVHPAFEDTAFACNAIQIDRFVDSFMYDQVAAEVPALQSIARARRAVTVFGALLADSDEGDEPEKRLAALQDVAAYSRTCTDSERCFPVRFYSKLGVDFDAAVKLQSCLRTAESDNELNGCWTAYSARPHSHAYMVDSGVRERPYSLDPELDFVTGRRQQRDALWPIEFMVQAVPIDRQGNDIATGLAQQADPWQFPLSAQQLQDYVAVRIAANPDAAQIFRNVRDFVALQRFFRLALDGQLGSEFPLDDLVALSAQTRSFVRVVRNERWNPNPQLFGFMNSIESVSLDYMRGALPTTSATCAAAISSVLKAQEASDLGSHSAFWKFMASLEKSCAGESDLPDLRSMQRILRRQELIGEAIALTQPGERKVGLACGAL